MRYDSILGRIITFLFIFSTIVTAVCLIPALAHVQPYRTIELYSVTVFAFTLFLIACGAIIVDDDENAK